MLQLLVHRIARGLSMGTSAVAVFLAAAQLFAASASADPSTSIDIDGIVPTEKGFVVTGKVTCKGPVSGGGESHSYRVYAVADIKDSKVARFPKLAEYLVIRPPAGAETDVGPGSGLGNLMTIEERDGIDCTSLRTGPQPGTDKFELIIPIKHGGKMVRIRAYLNYQYNNVGTPWPMIKFYHDIGYEGVLPSDQPMNEGKNWDLNSDLRYGIHQITQYIRKRAKDIRATDKNMSDLLNLYAERISNAKISYKSKPLFGKNGQMANYWCGTITLFNGIYQYNDVFGPTNKLYSIKAGKYNLSIMASLLIHEVAHSYGANEWQAHRLQQLTFDALGVDKNNPVRDPVKKYFKAYPSWWSLGSQYLYWLRM